MNKDTGNTPQFQIPITPGDAYYILQGTPQKAVNPQTASASEITDVLVQFDLKFDSLKTFLESVIKVVNQHATMINKLSNDVNTRVLMENITDTIRKFGSKTVISNPELWKSMLTMTEKPLLETTGIPYDDYVNIFCNRLEAYGNGFVMLDKKQKEAMEAIRKTKEEMSKKVYASEFKEKLKKKKRKLENKLRVKIEETKIGLEDRIATLEKKVITKVEDLQNKFADLEKSTLWRIRDCEELLKIRVNEKYVNDALAKLEERLNYEIKKFTEGNNENIGNILSETIKKISVFEEAVEDKINQLRKSLKDTTENTNRKLDLIKFDEFKREINAKAETINDKLKEFMKKFEPTMDKVNYDNQKLETKMSKLEAKINSLAVNVENYILNGSQPQKQDNKNDEKVKQQELAVDNAKRFAEMEAYFAKYKEDIHRNHQLILQVQEELVTKLDVGAFNLQIARKVDKDEFNRAISSFAVDEEKFKRAIALGDEIQIKLDRITDQTDKKIAKLRKDLDLSHINKLLKAKAEEEHVSRGFTNVDTKIQALSEALAILRKDLDMTQTSIKTFGSQMLRFSDNGLITTKQMNPQQCLACGNTASLGNTYGQVRGSDGKLYKGDVRALSVGENGMEVRRESFGNLNPNKSLLTQGHEDRAGAFFSSNSPRSTKARPMTPEKRPISALYLKSRPVLGLGGNISPLKASVIRPGSAQK